MKYNSKELCLIWLDSFLGLDYKHKMELYKLIHGKTEIKNVLINGKDYIESELGKEKYETLLNGANGVYLNALLDGLNEKGVTAVTIESNNYPESLKEISHPPLVLYAKGNLDLLGEKRFAIVGSRKSLPLSVQIAKDYAKALDGAGLVLTTGIAEGIDKAVIDGALDGSGKVISVFAGGLDCVYPKSHENLVEDIVRNGLVISEYPLGVSPKPFSFPIRNRIIAGLCVGALIVSAGKKSGTMYTAEYAEEFGRDLFAVPYGIGVSSGAGCNDLIKRGAMLTDTPDDILDFYGIEKKENKPCEITDLEREIISVLKDGGQHVERIASALGKQPVEVTTTLAIMEIKGLVVKAGVNIYGLTRLDMEE